MQLADGAASEGIAALGRRRQALEVVYVRGCVGYLELVNRTDVGAAMVHCAGWIALQILGLELPVCLVIQSL